MGSEVAAGCDGPDTITVFPQGEPHDISIGGKTDPAAVELGLDLYTTFRFLLPEVLGLVGFCEIRSKGRRTRDNLYARLSAVYADYGSQVQQLGLPGPQAVGWAVG